MTKDNILHRLTQEDILGYRIGEKLLFVRDSNARNTMLKSVRTDLSRHHLLHNVEFEDKSTIDTRKEFLLPTNYYDIANILAIAQNYIRLYQEIMLDNLQHIVNPKALFKNQED